ncbi:Beta-1,3-glucan-binding protein 1 [Gryllus bimaculatus]|nr:Beta-1,3-glucan-binding protein 1 [Gryllus bimaculatus]
MTLKRIFLRLVLVVLLSGIHSYEIPQATLVAFKPRGFQVSIPDSDGVQIFAFHGNVNKEMANREAGEMSVDILRPKNGRWVYENPRIRLKVGDVINYWLYVQVDGLGYPKDDLTWKVTELVDKDSSQATTPSTPTPGKCELSHTTVNGVRKCENELVFEETFDNLQRPKWENVVQFGGDPGYPFVLYTNKDDNCFVRNGFLHIKPSLQSDDDVTSGAQHLSGCTGTPNSEECTKRAAGGFYLPPVFSAQLRTKQSFSFCYGKVEIKAKLPVGDWIFSELLLQPKELAYGSKPKLTSGQINLALLRGNKDLVSNGQQIGAKCLHGVCELAMNDVCHREDFNETRQSLWSGAFHVYGATWTPDYIAFTVDGSEIGRVVPPRGGLHTVSEFSSFPSNPWATGTKLAPFDKEFYIGLGLGVGGFTEFPDDSTSGSYKKPWKNGEAKAIAKFWNKQSEWYPTWNDADSTLQVDYVRVWALPKNF